MGWTATTIPEEYGGLGMSHPELVVIAGSLAVHVHLCLSVLRSISLPRRSCRWGQKRRSRLGYKLADGSAIGCFALGEAGGAVTPDQISTSMADGVINGTRCRWPMVA